MTITDKTELYLIARGALVYICYGACPDISVQQRLAKKLNEEQKDDGIYYVVPIVVKDLSVRTPTVTQPKHTIDKYDRMVS
jgi:hypothetical protein